MMQRQHHVGYEDVEPSSSSSTTLLIRHLPEAIPHNTLITLFSHYGASLVRPFAHGRMKNCAFVDFKSEILASQAQKQLHGLRFMGKVLSVERATKGVEDTDNRDNEKQIKKSTEKSTGVVKEGSSDTNTRDGSSLQSEPIAQKLGVDYPFPPHLEYAYPPPDGHILTNIVNALIAVPRFYTQVLHLMNKMNIPAPFRKALPTPPLPEPAPAPALLSSEITRMENPTSSESEMESDEEMQGEARRKRVKRQAIVGPAVDKDVAHEAVGVKPVVLAPKAKPIIRKTNPVLKINIAPKQIQSKQEDEIAVDKSLDISPEEPSDHPYATTEELKCGRLPPEEILSLPRFKNYTAGDPTPVLYIKNLAKDVVVDDFYFIFGSFFESLDAAKANLSVKLMQEGRMKGQAFVTFPTVELARTALIEANGFVFKGKPIIIQFGRSSGSAGK